MAQRSFASSLQNFTFECIGSTQTDDELIICKSLTEFGRLIHTIEDERDRMVSTSVCLILFRESLSFFLFFLINTKHFRRVVIAVIYYLKCN